MDSSDQADLGFDISVEPAAIQSLSAEQKERLTDVLDRYLSALESGIPPQPDELIKDHPDLAGPLESYLGSLSELHSMAAGFGSPTSRAEVENSPAENDGKRLGDYRLVREVGRGGMGVVYEAHQISLGRRVALKVLPFAAVLDSKQIARFKNEAQAAAQLHHPNIVPVFAVGADRGVHYYAMQFIDGQPLDRAIAELQTKSGASRGASAIRGSSPATETQGRTAAGGAVAGVTSGAVAGGAVAGGAETDATCQATRASFLSGKLSRRHEYFRAVMRLGVQAADALHAAHGYGVVHRDIKPSNLLLDGDGKLWVTDFGLARCQTDLALTKTGDVVGTMRYMSPEQALGQHALVDQRTDVYSLGVTLYELLTLQAAFPGDGPVLLRHIEQHDPARPRQLQPLLPADLETVVLKAMAKGREDRYTTAEEFADDLRRVLEGKPTVARPPTIADRLGKWTRRHSRLVASVAAAGLLTVIGLAAGTLLVAREKVVAERNYQRAEQHFRQAQDAVDRFGSQLAERLADVPGADQVRRELLQETLQYYKEFVSQAADDPTLRADLALTYSKIGTLTDQIGSAQDAIAAHDSARKILEQLAADQPSMADYRRRLALCQNNLALALHRAGRSDEARGTFLEAIRGQQRLVSERPDTAQYRGDLALSHNNLGSLQSETGATSEAEASFRQSIRLHEELASAAPSDPEVLRNLAASYNNLGALHASQRPREAEELYAQALAYQTTAADLRPGELKYLGDVALTLNNLGAVQSGSQDLVEAARSYAQAIEIQEHLVRRAPAQNSYRRDLAVSYNNLGLTQSRLGRSREAENSFRDALQMQNLLAAENPHDIGVYSSLGGIYNNLGMMLEELDRIDEAAEAYKLAVTHQEAARRHAPAVDRYRMFLSKHYYNYGRVLRQLGRAEEAVRMALARKELWPGDPQRLLAVAEELALASELLGAPADDGTTAEQCVAHAIETLQEAVAAGWKPPADFGQGPFAALKNHAQFAELVNR